MEVDVVLGQRLLEPAAERVEVDGPRELGLREQVALARRHRSALAPLPQDGFSAIRALADDVGGDDVGAPQVAEHEADVLAKMDARLLAGAGLGEVSEQVADITGHDLIHRLSAEGREGMQAQPVQGRFLALVGAFVDDALGRLLERLEAAGLSLHDLDRRMLLQQAAQLHARRLLVERLEVEGLLDGDAVDVDRDAGAPAGLRPIERAFAGPAPSVGPLGLAYLNHGGLPTRRPVRTSICFMRLSSTW